MTVRKQYKVVAGDRKTYFVVRYDPGTQDLNDIVAYIADQMKCSLEDVQETDEQLCELEREQVKYELHRMAEQCLDKGYIDYREPDEEKPEPPHHQSKLWKYCKRRKFINKPYWNRVRSRLF